MGFLFENVVDVKGKKYPYSVAIGVMSGSIPIYAAGLQCEPKDVLRGGSMPWNTRFPRGGGVRELPRGRHDRRRTEERGPGEAAHSHLNAGFRQRALHDLLQLGHQGSRDGHPEHRELPRPRQSSRSDRGFPSALGQDIYLHWQKCKAKGIPLEAALVIGPAPCLLRRRGEGALRSG